MYLGSAGAPRPRTASRPAPRHSHAPLAALAVFKWLIHKDYERLAWPRGYG